MNKQVYLVIAIVLNLLKTDIIPVLMSVSNKNCRVKVVQSTLEVFSDWVDA